MLIKKNSSRILPFECWRRSTCFCNAIQSADSRLVGPRAEVQFDGKCLTSSHDQALYAVEICAVFHVVILALQVTVVDIQSCIGEREFPYVREEHSCWSALAVALPSPSHLCCIADQPHLHPVCNRWGYFSCGDSDSLQDRLIRLYWAFQHCSFFPDLNWSKDLKKTTCLCYWPWDCVILWTFAWN